MSRIAVFPGSFDPLTTGHDSIIRRAATLFDTLIVAIGDNSSKKQSYSLEQRIRSIQNVYSDLDNVIVDSYAGLTIDYCREKNANFIIRGLRTSADFEFERGIAQMNRSMNSDIDTLFLLTPPELSAVSSSIVRDIVKHGGDASQFVPKGVEL